MGSKKPTKKMMSPTYTATELYIVFHTNILEYSVIQLSTVFQEQCLAKITCNKPPGFLRPCGERHHYIA